MNIRVLAVAVLVTMTVGPGATHAAGAARAATPAAPSVLKVAKVELIAMNRAFPDYNERITARPREEFPIGDTEYSARIVEFVPAFSMNLKTHKVVSTSKEPDNPAFRIVVEKSGVPEDTTWAFLNMPPHFGRRSLMAFLIERIEFENHAPVAATKPGAPPKAHP